MNVADNNEEDYIDYEGEDVKSIVVSYDEENEVFYVEINQQHGFIIDPKMAVDFISSFSKVIDEIIASTFESKMNPTLKFQHGKAARKIEIGDEEKAVAEIERMLKAQRDDRGPLAS